jgi:hypothetical protein
VDDLPGRLVYVTQAEIAATEQRNAVVLGWVQVQRPVNVHRPPGRPQTRSRGRRQVARRSTRSTSRSSTADPSESPPSRSGQPGQRVTAPAMGVAA